MQGDFRMPQIWLTDSELGKHLFCAPETARGVAISRGWTRKRSRDGNARTCLPPAVALSYIACVARYIPANPVHALANDGRDVLQARSVG